MAHTMVNGKRYRAGDETWVDDSQCLTELDARQVVSHYRDSYSYTRFNWLMRQAYNDTPFAECAEVFKTFI